MKTKYVPLLIIIAILTTYAQCLAQPSSVKNAAKSVFKLTTYKEDGNVHAETNGIFIDTEGTAISALTPLLGADKATITDSRGHQAEVIRIAGADELYNMVKFKVEEAKPKPLELASVPAKAGDKVWIITYGEKGTQTVETTVNSVETFMDKYNYYILGHSTTASGPMSCVLVNDNGKVLGLTKPSNTTAQTHAVDANYAISLSTTGFALNDPVLSKIGIPPTLPEKQDQALLLLIMSGQTLNPTKQQAIATDYIAQYPAQVDGYTSLARIQVDKNKFKEAAATMEKAIKQADKKDEAYAAYGKLIYDACTYSDTTLYSPWTLDLATSQTEKANTINPLPTYRHQLAQINFAKGQYQEAYDEFTALLTTPVRNPELFYEASRCKVMMNAPQTEIIALLDSAINTTDTLRMNEAAPYFIARAEAHEANGNYREAVFDYTRYEILAATRPNANFYHTRARAEIKARLYQQALADMAATITLAPDEPTYYAEMASLQLRVNLTDDAIKTSNRCIELAPDYSDGYLILGLAQIGKGDKAAGLENLRKADQLGNSQAKPLIDKYSTAE